VGSQQGRPTVFCFADDGDVGWLPLTRERDTAMLAIREAERHRQNGIGSRTALAARGVRKSFRGARAGKTVRAVDDVTLEVRRGEIYGLLGANGSGKSTLIRVFSTLLEADAGDVRVFGLDVRADELAVKRLINRVSVEASFFKKLSAMENLVYAGRLYGLGPDEVHERARAILRRLGIADDRLDEPLEKLSRGMQQKVAIARAFLTAPMLLLLDEPTTGLDIRSKREVQTFVRDLREQHDATIVLTTHDLDEAARLADRIGIIHSGRLVAEGSVEELTARVGGRDLEEVFMSLTGRRLEEADQVVEEASSS
jgi:ABC-2 type transport system ATP-binding protein